MINYGKFELLLISEIVQCQEQVHTVVYLFFSIHR